MTFYIIIAAAFVGVSALVGGVALLLRGDSHSEIESRLELLTGKGDGKGGKGKGDKQIVLGGHLDDHPSPVEVFFSRIGNVRLLFVQADTTLTASRFLSVSVGCGVAGGAVSAITGIHVGFVPAVAVAAGFFPLLWLVLRRRRRLSRFAGQLPDALELMARALRSGHSLASGFSLVPQEMADPIAKEFNRVFEEQNLGIPVEEALEHMTDRVPNLDLRFFATAVILQRQTGGDLAEILDKIGRLVRERFQIWGQVQALTGEGRLSGIVLMALPPALFVAVYRMNQEYVMLLFTDDLGKKLLVAGILLQILGAIVIKKIVSIKV